MTSDMKYITIQPDEKVAKHLVLGDEFLIGDENIKGIITEIKKSTAGIYTMKLAVDKMMSQNTDLSFYLYRSGRRNLLGASVGSVTAMVDPTNIKNRTTVTHQREVEIPPCDACEK